MFSFTISNASGVTKVREGLTEDAADDLYFECIGKAHKVIQQNDNIESRDICRFAKASSKTDTYTFYVSKM